MLASMALLLACASPAQSNPRDWVSAQGGPLNDSRIHSVGGIGSWFEIWRRPAKAQAGWPLISGGVVVSHTPNTSEFAAIDIATGVTLWTQVTAPSYNDGYLGGCIAGNRLFVGKSNNGSGYGAVTSGVSCIDLASGAVLWAFDSGVVGQISSLQATPASPGGDRVVCTIGDRGVSSPWTWNNNRVFVLDATAASAATALLGMSAGNAGPRYCYQTPAVWSAASTAPGVFFHEYSAGASWVWYSARVRSLDVSTLVEPNPATLPLSGVSLSSAAYTHGASSLIVDGNSGEGFTYDTSGRVVAFDLTTMQQTWTSPLIGSTEWLQPSVLDSVVILGDPAAGSLIGLSRINGSVLWTRSTSANTLPAAPTPEGAIVLDGDRLMMPFADGGIRTVDATGSLGTPLATVPGARFVRAWRDQFLVGTNTELIAFATGFEAVSPGCGQATITPSGNPTLGGSATFQLSGLQGLGFLVLGLLPGVQPICPQCTLGMGPGSSAMFASSVQVNVPNNVAFRGLRMFVQGVDFLAPGGCLLPAQFTLTAAIGMSVR